MTKNKVLYIRGGWNLGGSRRTTTKSLPTEGHYEKHRNDPLSKDLPRIEYKKVPKTKRDVPPRVEHPPDKPEKPPMSVVREVLKHLPKTRKEREQVKKIGLEIRDKLATILRGGKPKPEKGRTLTVTAFAGGTVTKSEYSATMKHRHKTMKKILDMATKGQLRLSSAYPLASSLNQQISQDMGGAFSYVNGAAGSYATFGLMTGNFELGTSSQYDGAFEQCYLLIPTNSQTGRMFFKKCKCETTIVNSCNTTVYVTMYELMAKHDLQSTPSLSDRYVWSPLAAWSAGLSATQSPYSGSTASPDTVTSYYVPGSKPYLSPLFNEYWEIMGTYNIELSVGSSHVHTSTYTFDMPINRMRWNNSALLGGITRNYLFIVKGIPAQGNAQDGVSKTGLAPSKVEIRHDTSYTFSDMYGNATYSGYFDKTDNLGVNPTIVTVDNPTATTETNT